MTLNSSDNIQLSVVVPVYNEESYIKSALEEITSFLEDNQNYSWELIVVDDGSKDATSHIIENFADNDMRVKCIHYSQNRGKGFAVRTGVLESVGQFIVFIDADLSTPIWEINNALPLLEQGADLVLGSRAHPASDIIVQPSMYRRLASTIFDFVRNTIVGLNEFSDTQCGFKAAQSVSIKPIYSQALIDRFMFDVEILFLAKKSKLDIKELPVVWKDSPGSTVKFWSGVYEMFRDLIFIRRVHG